LDVVLTMVEYTEHVPRPTAPGANVHPANVWVRPIWRAIAQHSSAPAELLKWKLPAANDEIETKI
jgi:hypothetical protein